MSNKHESRTKISSDLSGIRLIYLTASWDEISRVYDVLTKRISKVMVLGEVNGDSVVSFSSFNGGKQVTSRRAPKISNPGERKITRYLVYVIINLLILVRLITSGAIVCDVALCQSQTYVALLKVFHKLGAVRRIVFYTGDYFPYIQRRKLLERVATRLSSTLDNLAWDEADAIWCYTHVLRRRIINDMESDSTKTIEVIPPLYFPAKDGVIDTIDPRIIFLGQIRTDAGIDIVLKALAKLRETNRAPKLELIGRPIAHDTIRQITQVAEKLGVADLLIVTGFVTLEDLRSRLQKALCGLAIFPGGSSNYSNYAYPNKVKSYLENGTVALIGNKSALSEHSELKDSCIFVDETPDAIAEALSFLLANPDTANHIGACGYKYAQSQEYSPDLFNALERATNHQRAPRKPF